MHGMKTIKRLGSVLTVLLSAGVIISGCATGFNYSFDPAAGYTGLKSYNWVMTGTMGQTSDLVVKNVQYQADQVLEKKGFRKTTENPDMLVSVNYENEIGINQYGYQLRMLTLGIQKADGNQMIWRGTATGTIHADAASNDLKGAVQGILASFPPTK
jgi:hypothetical protein